MNVNILNPLVRARACVILFSLIAFETTEVLCQNGGYYLMEYRADGINYNTFAIDSGNGRGLMRVRYKVGRLDYLVEQRTQIMRDTVQDKKTKQYDSRLVLTGLEPKFIGKEPLAPYLPDIIALKADRKTGLYVPDFVYTEFSYGRVYGRVKNFHVLQRNSDELKTALSGYGINNVFERLKPSLTKATIHLVLLTNSKDANLGTHFENNREQVLNTFKDVATVMDADFKLIDIVGENFAKQAVFDRLKFVIKPMIDIVVFYYSGHGYCYSPPPDTTSTERWPAMILTNSPSRQIIYSETLKFKDVCELLIEKDAGLTMAFAECCNIPLPGQNQRMPKTLAPALTAGGFIWNPVLVSNLFSRKEKVIVATSRPTEFTVYWDELDTSNKQRGYGYFCRNFIKELNSKLSTESIQPLTWSQILRAAAAKTTLDVSEKSLDQHAMIEIRP